MPFAQAIDQAKPSVLKLDTSAGSGSGFAVARRAVLTNAHVLAGRSRVTLTDHRGGRGAGRVVWSSTRIALAVVQALDGPLHPIQIGDAKSVVAGNEVVVI